MVVKGKETIEQDIELEPDTLLLANNMIGWFDLMYSTLPLRAGESFNIPAFFPGNLLTMTVTIDVHPEQVNIDIGGKNYKVFICDVPAFKETDYVTKDGLLVKIEIPAQKVIIELAE